MRNRFFPYRALCTARDIDGLALSMLAVGRDGVECLVPLEMNEEELDELRKTAATVKAIADDVFGEAA